MQPLLSLPVLFLFLFQISKINSLCPSEGIYVSTTGSDSTGNGSMSNPYGSITMAYNVISSNPKPSGSICFFPGNYSDVNEIWDNGFGNIFVVAVDDTKVPVFSNFQVQLSLPNLTIESIVVSTDFHIEVNNRTSLVLNDIKCDYLTMFIHSPNTTLIISGFTANAISVTPYLSEPYCNIEISDSMLGNLFTTSTSISVSETVFTGAAYLNAAVTIINACEFIKIRSLNCALNIVSYNWNQASHTIRGNKFINNTMTTLQFDSTICVRDILSATLLNNIFSCNMLAVVNQTSSVSRILPLGLDTRNWLINGNSVNPACPICGPGYEPVLDGINGCNQCAHGWVSPGITDCIACPPGTYSNTPSSNCTKCEPGRYSDTSNKTRCDYCSIGTPTQDHTSCIPCPYNHYSFQGLCQKCSDSDSDKNGCLDCGFFTTVSSDCKSLTASGVVIVLFLVATVVVGLIAFVCLRRKGYSAIPNNPNKL